MKRKAGRGRTPRPGPQGQGPDAASAGTQRWRQPAECGFRGDLYSQESTFPLVSILVDILVLLM